MLQFFDEATTKAASRIPPTSSRLSGLWRSEPIRDINNPHFRFVKELNRSKGYNLKSLEILRSPFLSAVFSLAHEHADKLLDEHSLDATFKELKVNIHCENKRSQQIFVWHVTTEAEWKQMLLHGDAHPHVEICNGNFGKFFTNVDRAIEKLDFGDPSHARLLLYAVSMSRVAGAQSISAQPACSPFDAFVTRVGDVYLDHRWRALPVCVCEFVVGTVIEDTSERSSSPSAEPTIKEGARALEATSLRSDGTNIEEAKPQVDSKNPPYDSPTYKH